MSNIPVITSEIFVAYSQCHLKAFLLLFSKDKGIPHDYPLILKERRQHNRTQYLATFLQVHSEARQYDTKAFKKHELLVEATLRSEYLEAYCAVLTKADISLENRWICYEPTIVTGTYSVSIEQKTELLFIGLVLGRLQKNVPALGRIIGMDGKVHRISLKKGYKSVKPSLKILQNWCDTPSIEPPTLILNKHCISCQFRQTCRKQAEKENNLSLLDRMTPKVIQKYNKRGIFTVQQLSYLFKPRRKRKKRKKPEPIKHSFELQSLAIREQTIYIQELSELARQPVELFLDIEGIPDQHFFYLIGLLVCEGKKCDQYSFWADTLEEEELIWKQLLIKLDEYPEAPICHYGRYEEKVFIELSKRYSNEVDIFRKRLINVNSFIFGKIYFPVYSNSLKTIGDYIDAEWTSNKASGLQSLAWRYRWVKDESESFKKTLIQYNIEDCYALKLLKIKISKIKELIKSEDNIKFADQIKKLSTETGKLVHKELELILNTSYLNYDKNKLTLHTNKKDLLENKPGKVGAKDNHIGHYRIVPKPDKTIQLPMRRECPQCQSHLHKTEKAREKIVIDLLLKKNGFQKKIIKYHGPKGYCNKCRKFYNSVLIDELNNELFSRSFKAWIVYQRLFLRLPFNVIKEEIQELFNENISEGTITTYLANFPKYYLESETILLTKILESPFLHVDETPINIRGINQYVWTFTDGKHVVFKLTETRESDIVYKTLYKYNGVLVSDFYCGYDSIPCKQQKCWVHLIRDMNDDLYASPFDTEYETFILKVKEFIVPIFASVDKYGLKKRNLRKFKKNVDRFYIDNISTKIYYSELSIKYQKRFKKFRESLFTFLEHDSIPWHNNTAERSLRHIAVQRKISGYFYESGAISYLIMLGIMQTCRFQEKSFLRFLMSGQKDIDVFRSPKIRKKSKAVEKKLLT